MTSGFSRRTLVKASAAALAASTAWNGPQVIAARSQTPATDTIEVSWATWVTGPVDEDNLVRQTILERFNIDLQMLGFERGTWFDQINTRVGGGDVPDIIYRDGTTQLNTYVEQGVLREVPYDAIRQSSPNSFAAANAFSADVWLATWNGGANYGLPFCSRANCVHSRMAGVRTTSIRWACRRVRKRSRSLVTRTGGSPRIVRAVRQATASACQGGVA